MTPAAVILQITNIIEAAIALRAGVAFFGGFGPGEMDVAHV